jgi:hypothetical protein
MASSQSDIDELKNLQREATELRVKRDRAGTTGSPAVEQASETTQEANGEQPQNQKPAAPEQSPETDEAIRKLAVKIDSAVEELEEAARERPALALLAAFTVGVVVGQLFSRR